MSKRTHECIKKRRQFTVLSWILCFGLAGFLFVYGFATKWSSASTETAEHIKKILIIWVMSILPLSILSFLVKDKIKPTIRMLNVIMSAYLIGNWFMFISGALMLFDAYVLSALIQKYKVATITNKELDRRDEEQ